MAVSTNFECSHWLLYQVQHFQPPIQCSLCLHLPLPFLPLLTLFSMLLCPNSLLLLFSFCLTLFALYAYNFSLLCATNNHLSFLLKHYNKNMTDNNNEFLLEICYSVSKHSGNVLALFHHTSNSGPKISKQLNQKLLIKQPKLNCQAPALAAK